MDYKIQIFTLTFFWLFLWNCFCISAWTKTRTWCLKQHSDAQKISWLMKQHYNYKQMRHHFPVSRHQQKKPRFFFHIGKKRICAWYFIFLSILTKTNLLRSTPTNLSAQCNSPKKIMISGSEDHVPTKDNKNSDADQQLPDFRIWTSHIRTDHTSKVQKYNSGSSKGKKTNEKSSDREAEIWCTIASWEKLKR